MPHFITLKINFFVAAFGPKKEKKKRKNFGVFLADKILFKDESGPDKLL